MDFLKDCMNDVGNPPLDAMHKNWCLVCANRGCERAGLNQSAFDKRVKNWREILFTNVPRAAADDPAYDNIRAKQFTVIGPPAPPKVTVFTPGIPTVSVPVPMANPGGFVRQPPRPDPEVAVPAMQEEPALDLEPVAPPTDEMTSVRSPPPGNTQFEQGMILGGGPPAPQTTPEPPAPGAGLGKTYILEDDE